MRAWIFGAGVLLACACGDKDPDDTGADAGGADAGATDDGATDDGGSDGDPTDSGAGAGDSGAGDSGAGDSGAGDSGTCDTGTGDTGTGDTGGSDTGAADTGAADTGVADTGAADTGVVATETDCTDGADDDGDGLVDCEDGDCAGLGLCGEEDCTDGIDDDSDGWTDCADDDCWGTGICDIEVYTWAEGGDFRRTHGTVGSVSTVQCEFNAMSGQVYVFADDWARSVGCAWTLASGSMTAATSSWTTTFRGPEPVLSSACPFSFDPLDPLDSNAMGAAGNSWECFDQLARVGSGVSSLLGSMYVKSTASSGRVEVGSVYWYGVGRFDGPLVFELHGY